MKLNCSLFIVVEPTTYVATNSITTDHEIQNYALIIRQLNALSFLKAEKYADLAMNTDRYNPYGMNILFIYNSIIMYVICRYTQLLLIGNTDSFTGNRVHQNIYIILFVSTPVYKTLST